MNLFGAEDLTDEHIIPEAIHGALVIKNGAFKNCAYHSNNAYENHAINADLQVPRLLLGLKGKGKRSGPGESRHLPPVHLRDAATGGVGRRLDFPVEIYPRQFFLVYFEPAGFLVGVDRGASIEKIRFAIYFLDGKGPQMW